MAGNGAALSDSSCHSVGRKGWANIKDVQQAFLGHHSLCREYHKGYQDTSKRGAVSPVTASTKLGCFQYW